MAVCENRREGLLKFISIHGSSKCYTSEELSTLQKNVELSVMARFTFT